MKTPRLEAGSNFAMKVPEAAFDATVAFYRDTVGLTLLEELDTSVVFAFGPVRLWIDKVPGLAKTEVWLEVVAEDTGFAATRLAAAGVQRCDDVEPLPDGFDGFWITNPAGVVHLVSGKRAPSGD